ncbi:MAG: hypothetical protein HYW95_01365 [Candidatus Wildermuthbacteria bacterium]|nr:hypothetical protein [Candidatus Wildermuthbacteria bacterium]
MVFLQFLQKYHRGALFGGLYVLSFFFFYFSDGLQSGSLGNFLWILYLPAFLLLASVQAAFDLLLSNRPIFFIFIFLFSLFLGATLQFFLKGIFTSRQAPSSKITIQEVADVHVSL